MLCPGAYKQKYGAHYIFISPFFAAGISGNERLHAASWTHTAGLRRST
jgi:hypothetical protein